MFGTKKKPASENQQSGLEAVMTAIDKSQAVIEFKLDGTIITANQNLLSTMGYSLSEIQGRHHSMFAPPGLAESDGYREFWQTLNQGRFVADKFLRVAKGGREVWLQATYNPVLDAAGRSCQLNPPSPETSPSLRNLGAGLP